MEEDLLLGPTQVDIIFSLIAHTEKMREEVRTEVAQRHNQGKIDLSLLPVEACTQEALVWGFGEKKYGRNNWTKLWGDNTVNVAMASLLRHAFAVLNGELEDSESGLPHAAHIRCNAAMILEYQKQQREKK